MPQEGDSHTQYKSMAWSAGRWKLIRMPRENREKCQAKFCREYARIEYRSGKMIYHPFCQKCASRQWNVNNPAGYTFKNLRAAAKKREIPFTLTREHFDKVCADGHYFLGNGVEPYSMHIDRIDACKGYEDGNIQILSFSDNVAKGNRERYLPEHVQEMKRRRDEMTRRAAEVADNCPVINGALCPF